MDREQCERNGQRGAAALRPHIPTDRESRAAAISGNAPAPSSARSAPPATVVATAGAHASCCGSGVRRIVVPVAAGSGVAVLTQQDMAAGSPARTAARVQPPRPGRKPGSAPSLPHRPNGGTTMRSAVIVSTARTPIGRAYRGAFNDTQSQALGGHVDRRGGEARRRRPRRDRRRDHGRRAATGRARLQHRAPGGACAPGLPDSVAGMSVDRQCASGMMAIATAAKQIMRRRHADRGRRRAGDRISLVQNQQMNRTAPRIRS